MDRQQMYDIVRDGLLAQGVVSRQSDGSCAYRGKNDHRCGVGFLIKDEDYSPDMEGCDVGGLKEEGLLPDYIPSEPQDIEFLFLIQETHDNHSPEMWKSSLEELAKDWGLVP